MVDYKSQFLEINQYKEASYKMQANICACFYKLYYLTIAIELVVNNFASIKQLNL